MNKMSMHIYSMGQNVKYFCVFTLRKEKILIALYVFMH